MVKEIRIDISVVQVIFVTFACKTCIYQSVSSARMDEIYAISILFQ